MTAAIIVTHANGEDRYDQPNDEFTINDDGLLVISREYHQEIIEKAIRKATRVPLAYYAHGQWSKILLDREEDA